jgi:putative DNA methylase
VIAWLWARTVKSPNPAFSHVDVPLVSTFTLSKKPTNRYFIKPTITGDSYNFKVCPGETPADLAKGTKSSRANFHCILSGAPIDPKYIKKQGKEGNIGARLLAVVAEGKRGRVYLEPTEEHELLLDTVDDSWLPSAPIVGSTQYQGVLSYGLETYAKLFTKRQIFAINTLCELIHEASEKARLDFAEQAPDSDDSSLSEGGRGAKAYGEAVALFLTFFLSRLINLNNALCQWRNDPAKEHVGHLFTRQAIPMVWDYAEANIFGNSAGSFIKTLDFVPKAISYLPTSGGGNATQADAMQQNISTNKVVSTDPPYYDNVPYADISDFFYVWLRRSLKPYFNHLLGTIATPKDEELVAFSYRHDNKKELASEFFMNGMVSAIKRISDQSHPAFPVTIYYAFKQSESKEGSTTSTGWVTFLEAVIQAGFSIDGTWPMRTELGNRMRSSGSNALASSIVLVCRKLETDAESISRRDFQRQLREEMPEALETMIGGQTGQTPIAPVDLAQSAIGPGMAIFTKYEAVLNQDGSRMSVHDALVLINRAITEYLNPDSGSFDADTQFCASWFEQYGWSAGQFGEANVLAQAKGTTVDGVRSAGVAESGSGKVRLLRWGEYESDWDPTKDDRTPVWEACHQMIRRLNNHGESAAGELLAKMPEKGEAIRQLAYHLYTLCERKKWAEEARAYNELIGSWHAIVEASHDTGHKGEQHGLDL